MAEIKKEICITSGSDEDDIWVSILLDEEVYILTIVGRTKGYGEYICGEGKSGLRIANYLYDTIVKLLWDDVFWKIAWCLEQFKEFVDGKDLMFELYLSKKKYTYSEVNKLIKAVGYTSKVEKETKFGKESGTDWETIYVFKGDMDIGAFSGRQRIDVFTYKKHKKKKKK